MSGGRIQISPGITSVFKARTLFRCTDIETRIQITIGFYVLAQEYKLGDMSE